MREKLTLLIFVVVFSISLISSAPCAGYNYLDNCVESSFDNTTINVNNSQYLQGLTPEQVADLYTETDPYWLANYSDFLTISAWNNTGLIQDWNVTGYIQNWSAIISGGEAGGGNITFGGANEIPFVNDGESDFDYSSIFNFDSSLNKLNVGSLFFRDFTNSSNYLVDEFSSDYNPLSDNADWEYRTANAENLKALSGDVELISDSPTPATRYYTYGGGNPATANYDVNVNTTLAWSSNNAIYTRVYGRWIDGNNYYMFYYLIFRDASGGGNLYLYLMKDGVSTLLDSVNDGLSGYTSGTKNVELTLRMDGDSIQGLVDGVVKVSATDGNLTQKGKAGLGHTDSYSSTANGNFKIHSFNVRNVKSIGQIGTSGNYDWFGMRNDIPIFQVQSDGIKFLEGNKIVLEDVNALYESSLQQHSSDYLEIGGTNTKFDNQLSAGSVSGVLLDFKSYTIDEENLYTELFNLDYDDLSDNPFWDILALSTAEYGDVSEGKLWTTDTYDQAETYGYTYSTEMTSNNYTVEVDIGLGWNSNNPSYGGVIARYEDDNNYWKCRVEALRGVSGGADLDLVRTVGGTGAIVNSSDLVVGDPNNPFTGNVKLVVEGGNYYCYFGDELKITYFDDENSTDATKVGLILRKNRYTQNPAYLDNWKAYLSGDHAVIGTKTHSPLHFKTGEVEWWKISETGQFEGLFDTVNISIGNMTLTNEELIIDKITAITSDPLMMTYTPTTFERIKRLDTAVAQDKKGLNFWFDSSEPNNLQAWNSLTGDRFIISMEKVGNEKGLEIKDNYYYDMSADKYYEINKSTIEVECLHSKEKCQEEINTKNYVDDEVAIKSISVIK